MPLYEFVDGQGRHAYAPSATGGPSGFTKQPDPVAYVWPSPIQVKLPVAEFLGN